jgi:hypothetical protein
MAYLDIVDIAVQWHILHKQQKEEHFRPILLSDI